MSEQLQQETQKVELSFSYTLELWMYGTAFCVGLPSFIFTVWKLARTTRQHLVLAARLFSYKISLTVADSIILFIYAPTQFLWIQYYWWFGGDIGCRLFKFISTFGFHLTANMQVLVAADRLLITAKMNRMNRNMKKRQYNTRLSLAAAWLLALICACPQLMLFRQRNTPEGEPQCISIWTEHRVEYYERLAFLEEYDFRMQLIEEKSEFYFHENGTMKFDPPEKPNFNIDELNTNNRNWLYLERLYNVLHLATICVLPYASELICYTLIVYILKGATRGKFFSLSDVFKELFCCCLITNSTNSLSESNATQESINLVSNSSLRKKRMNTVDNDFDTDRKRAASVDVQNCARSVACVNVSVDETGQAASTLHTDVEEPEVLNNIQRILGLCFKRRRDQCTSRSDVGLLQPDRRQSAPVSARTNTLWVVTVDAARRNARWKAFIMLSLNLFFWAPYCILAITSSIIVEPWLTNVQFVNALVTFNAVSNIIL